uniref:Uncharacterized protein n=1 Tax=Romanomermis culicivorax TaxID=13658 RepID=A0A915KM92_ROMCU
MYQINMIKVASDNIKVQKIICSSIFKRIITEGTSQIVLILENLSLKNDREVKSTNGSNVSRLLLGISLSPVATTKLVFKFLSANLLSVVCNENGLKFGMLCDLCTFAVIARWSRRR